MDYSSDILKYEEQITLQLRTLYRDYGYSQYRMSKFEEYELYASNRAFLPSGEILTFTGVDGRLMALRPDVTLSIVKSAKDTDETLKVYYNENVYRSDGVEFKEQMQVGLECIGSVDVELTGEVLLLAKRSLDILSDRSRLDISHMGCLSGLLTGEKMTPSLQNEIVKCISEKNISELESLCREYKLSDKFNDGVKTLAKLYGSYDDVVDELNCICINDEMKKALTELSDLNIVMKKSGFTEGINIDFSIINDISYYNGIIFQGYIEGIPNRVLSGGRYDELLRKFGKKSEAIGFAVYLDLLENSQPPEKPEPESAAESETDNNMIGIALPKGRLGEKAYAIFENAGYGCPGIREESRKLVFENPETGVRYFWVKPSDVAIYVERGVADIGIAGKDILLEYSPEVYELLDLGIGKCNMSVSAEKGFDPENRTKTLRVATKFPNIARTHYRKHGREIDVIELNGSIELAPILGLSDVIVDIVETGQTLLENEMEPIEKITDISARLVSNKVSYKFKHKKIDALVKTISEQLAEATENKD